MGLDKWNSKVCRKGLNVAELAMALLDPQDDNIRIIQHVGVTRLRRS